MFAQAHAEAGDVVPCAGMLAQATLCVAHGRLAERREWVLNEKRLVGAPASTICRSCSPARAPRPRSWLQVS